MSVERMKLLGITGKSEVMNNFLIKYIINSGLQLEDAIKVYEKGWKLTYFDYNTKPRELVKNIEKLMKKLGIEYSKQCLSDIKIKLNSEKRQHLLLTGKNGSGKTQLLLKRCLVKRK